ncbi:Hsp70 family protein [Microbacterium sp. gxy059]|uniref:Hsp70 family protein n=1 Tax=Microbacterium sp. gxy059 TaxID=2957199 RepID=UPI003D963F43
MAAAIRGVDFGTSTSLLSVSSPLGAELIPLGAQEQWMPSIAGGTRNRWLVGDDAATLPENSLIRSVKRAITLREQAAIYHNGDHPVVVDADDVIADLFRTISQRAASEFESVTDRDATVRLGCPAMWDGDQRRRLLDAAQSAGLNVDDTTLIDEPIAAGIAWVNDRLRRREPTRGKVLIYDMGGGTLDIAVLDVDASPGHPATVSVQSAHGTDVAGDAVDEEFAKTIRGKLVQEGVSTRELDAHPDLAAWLVRAAREAKVELSSSESALVPIPYPGLRLPVVEVRRSEFEQKFQRLLERSMQEVWAVARAALVTQSAEDGSSMTPQSARSLAEAELARGIRYVLLAGGMSRVPMITRAFHEWFRPEQIHTDRNPETLIARGLGADRAYDSLNLHRPGFSLVLSWLGDSGQEHEETLYPAYTPFYNRAKALTQSTLAFTYDFARSRAAHPRSGQGRITARAVTGEDIPFELDGAHVPGLPYRFGYSDSPVIRIRPTGEVLVRDEGGYVQRVYIDRWPVIQGRGAEAAAIHVSTRKPEPKPRTWWYDQSGD